MTTKKKPDLNTNKAKRRTKKMQGEARPDSHPATSRQLSWMYRCTTLKFWEPVQNPGPTVSVASEILEACFAYSNAVIKGNPKVAGVAKEQAVRLVSKFFPEWKGETLRIPYNRKRSKSHQRYKDAMKKYTGLKPEEEAEKPEQKKLENVERKMADGDDKRMPFKVGDIVVANERSMGRYSITNKQNGCELKVVSVSTDGRLFAGMNTGEFAEKYKKETPWDNLEQEFFDIKCRENGKAEPEKKMEPEKEDEQIEEPEEEKELAEPTTQDLIRLKIESGLKNLWLYGPAGTGKTTICRMIADELGMPCTIISCSSGTSAGEFRGFQFPEPRPSAFTQAFGQEGIIVFDEMSMLDPSVASVANSALANGEILSTVGTVKRHENCIIIATANTIGQGGDRQYIGNNQLDGATMDRFACGFIEVQYSKPYEQANFDKEVCEFVWKLREVIKENGFRRIFSTRAIIGAEKLKKGGDKNWKRSIVFGWTGAELQKAGMVEVEA